jgi:hypothetical protein
MEFRLVLQIGGDIHEASKVFLFSVFSHMALWEVFEWRRRLLNNMHLYHL